ncbi:TetR/AcrR family transcriptional regulator [Fulvivirgaceae bacterium BMA10]|uniref:TetR/AcrR family transcriptional regulator n=1 Tax=Splendidivirga corallicola TaxID=3051826 RepID=A0ABT8KQR2_9BACT|nr:TetR/AcrR family transcriptional regulator [Fulvivirgaceae bacterium BMA10]
MAGRYKAFNEEEVLSKAVEVFWLKGYEGASTQDLLEAMKLNKGSLYNTFGSKKELFIRSINHYAQEVLTKLDQDVENSDEPLEVIKDHFRNICDTPDYETHNKGCFFGNALSELANIDSELKKEADRKLKTVEDIYFKGLQIARQKGQLANDGDLRILAQYLLNTWNGINLTRRMYPEREDLEAILKLSLSVLN